MILKTIPRSSITKIKVYYNENAKKTMKQIRNELGCQYVINTTLFNMSTLKPTGYLTVNNVVYGATANPYGFAVKDKNIIFSYGNNVKYPDFTGCYHVLIRDGEIKITSAESAKYGYTSRSCVGLKANGDIVFLCDQSKRSLMGVAEDMLNTGCVTALNYDGGGSSQAYCDGQKLLSTRKVVAYLCVWTGTETAKKESNETTSDSSMSKFKVVLDPGHGATCTNGAPDKSYYEHEFALDVANRMSKILTNHGVNVKITRTNGTDITLSERVKISDDYNPNYFISLHSNAYGTNWNDANGWEVYVSGFGGNAEKLARAIESATREVIPLFDKGIKQANYTVIKNTKAPAILIEHGFHTNKKDIEYLKSDKWRDEYAKANCKGILSMFGIKYNEEKTGDKIQNSSTETKDENMEAVEWAKNNGVSDGSNLTENATRQQIITMMYRFYKKYGK